MTVEDVGELALIDRIRAGSRAWGGIRVGIGDDCAVLQVRAGEEMVVTTDFCLEGRHFRREWQTAEQIGHRCLLRGLSDVAAMGGRPVAAFLSLALPSGLPVAWVDGFLHGLRALGDRYGMGLAGGDTAEAPGEEVLADIVVAGAVRRGRALLRTGAKAGDGVYVTGRLGAAAAELAELMAGRKGLGLLAEPRLATGQALLRRGAASSCMDLSDGLSTDLKRLCLASGVGAELAAGRIPLASGATLQQGVHGGEDYELLFTASGKVPRRVAGVEVTRVGTIVEEMGVRMDGGVLDGGGWEHFSQGREQIDTTAGHKR